jgi:glycosyltransferase involved in cell wall biosynthesis
MRILIVTPIFPPDIGGPATYVTEIAGRLTSRGHLVSVVTFSEQPPEKIPGVRIMPLGTKYPVFGKILRQGSLLLKILSEAKKSDVVYLQETVTVGFVSSVAAKLLGKPVVLKFVGDIAWQTAYGNGRTKKFLEDFLKKPDAGFGTDFTLRLQRFVFGLCDLIITPSEYLKADVLVGCYGVDPKKVRVIYNAVDLRRYDAIAAQKPAGEPSLIIVSRLVKWKRTEDVVAIMPDVAAKYPKATLTIVGYGPEEEEIRKRAEALGVGRRVILRGKLPHEEMIAVLKGSDVFILNSVYEGLPHTVIEALACRVPVVATGIKGTVEVVKDDETGLLVDVGWKKKEMLEKISMLADDLGMKKKLADGGYRIIEDRFNMDKTMLSLEEALAGLAEK